MGSDFPLLGRPQGPQRPSIKIAENLLVTTIPCSPLTCHREVSSSSHQDQIMFPRQPIRGSAKPTLYGGLGARHPDKMAARSYTTISTIGKSSYGCSIVGRCRQRAKVDVSAMDSRRVRQEPRAAIARTPSECAPAHRLVLIAFHRLCPAPIRQSHGTLLAAAVRWRPACFWTTSPVAGLVLDICGLRCAR